MNPREARNSSMPPVRVSFRTTLGDMQSFQFIKPFRIGRVEECEIRIENDYVSRIHAEVVFEDGAWWVRDLNSSNGIFVGGQRVERASVGRATVIRLGIYGTEVSFELEPPPVENKAAESKPPIGSETMVARYVDHYFGKPANDQPAGEHTMYVRKAFQQVQTRQKRKYGKIIAGLLLVALSIGAYALYLHQQVRRQRAMAQDLFYTMKALDVDIANLEKALLDSNSQQGTEVIKKYESRRQEMEKNYDQFLAALHVYSPKMTEQQRLVLRIARIFGECELEMPKDFESEINRYIRIGKAPEDWQRPFAALSRTVIQTSFRKSSWLADSHLNSSISPCRKATSIPTSAAP